MKLLFIVLFFIFSLPANAQLFTYNYQINCGSTAAIIEFLSKTQKEELTWTGLDILDGSVYSLWQDAEGNWTLLKKTPEISCVLGAGTKLRTI